MVKFVYGVNKSINISLFLTTGQRNSIFRILFYEREKSIVYHVSKLDFGDLSLYNGPQTPEEMRRKGIPEFDKLENKQRSVGLDENASYGDVLIYKSNTR